MASYTTNLNLKKPSGSEAVAIGDINGNMDTIDTAYGSLNGKFVIETKQVASGSSVNIPANGYGTVTLDISKTGYTPKMLANANPWNLNLIIAFCDIDGSNAEFSIYNTSSSAVAARPRVTVLYQID